jgi:sugar-specific transcriptional regulator TrmB
MSEKRILMALNGLGLTKNDAVIYIFLAKQGPHKMRDIASVLKLHERKMHRSLNNLRSLCIVKASNEYPQELIAVPFKEVIDLFVEVKKEQAKAIQEAKDELLYIWQKMTKEKSEKT